MAVKTMLQQSFELFEFQYFFVGVTCLAMIQDTTSRSRVPYYIKGQKVQEDMMDLEEICQ